MSFVFAALLLIAVALVLALAPLWRARRKLALALCAALTFSSIGLYAWLGEPDALQSYWRDAPQDLPQALAQAERGIERGESDAGQWLELARLRVASGEYAKAIPAFDEALQRDGGQADWLIESAEARMRASADRRMPDIGMQQLQKALELSPDQPRGLLLLGAVQAQRGDAEAATATWQRLLPQLGAPAAEALRKEIATVRERAGLAPTTETTTASPALLRLTITSTQSVPNGAVLFVFARGPNGGMPLAAKRIENPSFPLQISLSDADSPMPSGKLSAQEQVTVQARLSLSGSADAAPGDLESAPLAARVGDADPLELALATRR